MVGRILLAIDIFFFYMKIFHMLMAFKKLGLLLVMMVKMAEDTVYFMIILLIFVLAYAVMSESLLYSPNEFSWTRLYQLPRKAYWQAFGELNLPEIEIRDRASCSVNASMHHGSDVPHCPTEFGSYVVPVLLGGHVMITNVLLFTLLMARFGVIFTQWHLEETYEYQSWYHCQIIAEYCNRTSWPPPFNLLYIVLVNILPKCGICCRCCGCRRTKGCGCGNRTARENPRPGEDMQLIAMSFAVAQRSADRRSIDITWINKLHASNAGNRSQASAEIMIKIYGQTQYTQDTYTVAKKECSELRQAFTIWDLDPKTEYTVEVAGEAVTVSEKDPDNHEDILKMIQFEDGQAEWASNHQDSNMTWLKDLQAETDTLKMEISKMAAELKENHGALKQDISKNSERSLKKMKDYSQKSKHVIKTIDDNLVKLKEFLSNIAQNVQDEGRKRKEAEKRKKNAEKELLDLTTSLAEQQNEVQQSMEESMEVLKKDMTTVLQRHEGLQQEQQKVMQQHLQELEEKHQAHLQQQQEQHQIHMQQHLQDLEEKHQAHLQQQQEQHQIHLQQQLQDLEEKHQVHMQEVLEQVKQVIKAGQEASETDVGSGQ